MLVDFKQKSQVTIPKEIVKKLHLQTGDKLDITESGGRVFLTPVAVIPKDQTWYYSPEWQAKEKAVDRQIKTRKIHSAGSAEELFTGLGLDKV